MKTKLQELADNPVGNDQIARAYEIIGDATGMKDRISFFLATNPNRGSMTNFLEELHVEVAGLHPSKSPKNIDFEVFKSEGTGISPLESLNKWKDQNPSVRVLNVETMMTSSGGGLDGDAVKIQSAGLRVWFERNCQGAVQRCNTAGDLSTIDPSPPLLEAMGASILRPFL